MAMKNPSHPGELVQANLDELEMNIADAAKALGMTQRQLSDIVAGKSAVSPEIAIRFEMAFGGSAAMWLRLQAAYDLAQARKHIGNLNISPVARLPHLSI